MHAAPNGLTQIPLAKVFGDGVAAFSIARAQLGSQTTLLTTQYGIGNSIELGLDAQTAPAGQQTLLGNIKALIAHHPGRLPDLACGLQNIATTQKCLPYLVATTQPRATGLSFGLIRTGGGAFYGLGGISYNLTPTFQLVADEIGGKANDSTFGFIASLSKTISLNVAYARPNTAGDDAGGTNPRGCVVNLSYIFHVKNHGSVQPGSTPKNPTAGGAGA